MLNTYNFIFKGQQRTSQEDSRTSSSQKKTCGARNVLLSAKSDSDAERNDTSKLHILFKIVKDVIKTIYDL